MMPDAGGGGDVASLNNWQPAPRRRPGEAKFRRRQWSQQHQPHQHTAVHSTRSTVPAAASNVYRRPQLHTTASNAAAAGGGGAVGGALGGGTHSARRAAHRLALAVQREARHSHPQPTRSRLARVAAAASIAPHQRPGLAGPGRSRLRQAGQVTMYPSGLKTQSARKRSTSSSVAEFDALDALDGSVSPIRATSTRHNAGQPGFRSNIWDSDDSAGSGAAPSSNAAAATASRAGDYVTPTGAITVHVNSAAPTRDALQLHLDLAALAEHEGRFGGNVSASSTPKSALSSQAATGRVLVYPPPADPVGTQRGTQRGAGDGASDGVGNVSPTRSFGDDDDTHSVLSGEHAAFFAKDANLGPQPRLTRRRIAQDTRRAELSLARREPQQGGASARSSAASDGSPGLSPLQQHDSGVPVTTSFSTFIKPQGDETNVLSLKNTAAAYYNGTAMPHRAVAGATLRAVAAAQRWKLQQAPAGFTDTWGSAPRYSHESTQALLAADDGFMEQGNWYMRPHLAARARMRFARKHLTHEAVQKADDAVQKRALRKRLPTKR